MVIFGAGASYDSCSSFPPEQWPRGGTAWHRPPLAKELFLNVPQFRGISRTYDRFQPLLPDLEAQENVEAILEGFREKAVSDVECRRQLWAVQYYLRELINYCQANWINHTHGVSNYRTLLDQVRECNRVCFVTFNYDTLLDSALQSFDHPLRTMSEYTSGPKFSLIKLHGSIDWKYWIPKTTTNLQRNDQPQPQDLIRAALSVGDRAIIDKDGNTPSETKIELHFYLPALAIPTASNQRFVCPPAHIQALGDAIRHVTRIAIVGWRAAERNFLEMLATGLPNEVEAIAACGNTDAAEATLGRLSAAGIRGKFQASPGGFTDFVVNRRIEPLLPT
jgi:hypothetical protein